MRDPWAWAIWRGVVALWLLLVMLLPLSARAQPAGAFQLLAPAVVPDGEVWFLFQRSRDGQLCSEPVVSFPSGSARPGEEVVPPAGEVCYADDYSASFPDPAVEGFWVEVLPLAGPPASGAAFSWDNSAHVLQLLLWGSVVVVGMFGYSMGARE